MSFVGVTHVPPGGDMTFVGRLPAPDGTPWTTTEFTTTWDAHLFDADGLDLYNNTALVVSDTDPIFNTLQTDGYWGGRDDTGYNFRWTVDLDDLSETTYGGETYIFLAIFDGGATYGKVRYSWKAVVESIAPSIL